MAEPQKSVSEREPDASNPATEQEQEQRSNRNGNNKCEDDFLPHGESV
jgi:hypothetical protein